MDRQIERDKLIADGQMDNKTGGNWKYFVIKNYKKYIFNYLMQYLMFAAKHKLF